MELLRLFLGLFQSNLLPVEGRHTPALFSTCSWFRFIFGQLLVPTSNAEFTPWELLRWFLAF
jgi:hypothetical protein